MASRAIPQSSWLSEVLRDLRPSPDGPHRLPRDTREALANIPELETAPAELWTELAYVRAWYQPELVRRRRELVRRAEEGIPIHADLGARLRAALDRVGLVLVEAYIRNLDGEFEAACPGWRAHAAALLTLRPIADRLARTRVGRHGRPQDPARGLARQVADVLAKYDIEPTGTKTGTFVRVIADLLDSLPHLGTHDAIGNPKARDAEWHARAIVHERKLARSKRGGKSA